MTSDRIPFFRPTLPSWEVIEPTLRAIHDSGVLTSGPFVRALEDTVASMFHVKHAVACANATLGMMLLLDTLPDGPTVVVPGYTFCATQQAVEWANGGWLWADVGEDCNITLEEVERYLEQSAVDAVLAVHVSGNPCDVLGLDELMIKYGVPVFYDAAHAFGSMARHYHVATWGKASVFSLSITKMLPAAGEGGIVCTDDDDIAGQVRLAVNHGRRPGSMDAECRGTNARMQEYSAAYALAMLPMLDEVIERRRVIRERYREALEPLDGVAFPPERYGCRATWKDASLFVDPCVTGWDAAGLAEALDMRGIGARRYYAPPAHQTGWMLSCSSGHPPSLPVTERLASQVVSLPIYPSLSDEEVNRVIDAARTLLGDGAAS